MRSITGMTLAIKEPGSRENGEAALQPTQQQAGSFIKVVAAREAGIMSAVLRGRCNYRGVADTLCAIMRTISHYKLIVNSDRESVEKEVNEFLKEQGYELYGSPFGCATSICQALVKHEHARSTQFPTTLQSHAY